ncbi:hypothetical protein D9M68_846920 [compost metagenome]
MAHQCAAGTRSLSTGTESAVISSGEMKNSVYAADSGSSRTPMVNSDSMAMPSTPRNRCSGQRTLNTVCQAPRQAMYSSTSGSAVMPRSAAICSTG